MIIRHSLPANNWTKIDNKVFKLNISAGAKVLYGYLCGLQNGNVHNDDVIADDLRISRQTLSRQKRELKDEKLLLVEQLMPRVYVAYIGHTGTTAQDVKEFWEKRDGILKS